MVDPIIWIASATAGLSVWVVVTGRPLQGLPQWRLDGAALRAAGVCGLLGSLVVIGLALTGNAGFAFVSYAVLAITLGGLTGVARALKAGT